MERSFSNSAGHVWWATTPVVGSDEDVVCQDMVEELLFQPRQICMYTFLRFRGTIGKRIGIVPAPKCGAYVIPSLDCVVIVGTCYRAMYERHKVINNGAPRMIGVRRRTNTCIVLPLCLSGHDGIVAEGHCCKAIAFFHVRQTMKLGRKAL